MSDRFTISAFEFFVLRTRTRFPFRYGIASLTEVPQLFVRARVTVGPKSASALASEGLPPKWFTKNPEATFEQELADMYEVIGRAASLAPHVASQPISFFDFSRELDRQQGAWAASRGFPPLLAHLGVSLIERVALDGLCRIAGAPLHQLVHSNRLGLRLAEVYPALASMDPSALLPSRALHSCFVRHTIGLADALAPGDIPAAERVDDGLPQDVESSIRAYGLRYFKVKLSASTDRDVPRLAQLVRMLERETSGDYRLTLDGNENFHDLRTFREFWREAQARAELRDLWPHVVVVEQPVHRDHALGDDARASLAEWPDGPPLIVDESDGAIGDVPLALDAGYAGASHKNCKGVLKGLANAAYLEMIRRQGRPAVLTGEDLCILGPVTLLQDLAMMALLNITHVERNGHHYYRGLSMLPRAWQDAAVESHGDLYRRHDEGFAHLRIEDGRIDLTSVNNAPFGVGPLFDPSEFEAVDLATERAARG